MILPEGDIDQASAEKYWEKDRSSLIQCKKSKEILKHYYEQRDQALSS